MTLNSDQSRAVRRLRKNDWEMGNLVGLAGTGKTFLTGQLQELLSLDEVVFATPTHKASAVLRGKLAGQHEVKTLAKLLWHWQPVHSGHCPRLPDGTCLRKGEDCYFSKEPVAPWPDLQMVIVDEASMLRSEDDDVLRQWAQEDVRVLLVGDPGQLPPVGDGGFNALDSTWAPPLARLKHIERQADGSEILDVAYAFRHGKWREDPYLAEVQLVREREISIESILRMDDVENIAFVTSSNNKRREINQAVRKCLGRTGKPAVGDRLMYLRNDDPELYNGVMCVRTRHGVRTEHGASISVPDREFLGTDREGSRWNYGYAITCHKAQGSEWPVVAVFPESKWRWRNSPDGRRWLYTAVTRASRDLILVRP